MSPYEYEEMKKLPPEYRPISAWGYFGYQLLFCIPIIGFILLIVFALSNDNINRRNFARSYFCIYVIVAIILISVLTTVGSDCLAAYLQKR